MRVVVIELDFGDGARAADSSTIVLFAAKVATRACRTRLFTAWGRPRPVWWISAAASSQNSWSLRPTSLTQEMIMEFWGKAVVRMPAGRL